LTGFDEVIIAPANTNLELILELSHECLSFLKMAGKYELVLQFGAGDRSVY
jgi:hypothetical protein